MMAYAIGVTLALGVAALGRFARLDRDRAYYPTVLIVVGHYYLLFAVMAGDTHALAMEAFGLLAFAAAALAGFRFDQRLVAIGLVAHGVFDAFHGRIITNPGVPEWWPAFCLAFDVAAGASLAYLSVRRTPANVFAKLLEAQ